MSKFLEIDIENYIWDLVKNARFDNEKLVLDKGVYFRQYKIEGVGIIDMLSIRIERYRLDEGERRLVIKVRVFELKRGAITCDDVGQISRYIDFIKTRRDDALKAIRFSENFELEVEGILIGRGANRDAMHILSLMYPTVFVWPFEFSLEKGISFDQDFLFHFSYEQRKKVAFPNPLSVPSLRCLKSWGGVETFDFRHKLHSENSGDIPF